MGIMGIMGYYGVLRVPGWYLFIYLYQRLDRFHPAPPTGTSDGIHDTAPSHRKRQSSHTVMRKGEKEKERKKEKEKEKENN
jgi:hypothetical protein